MACRGCGNQGPLFLGSRLPTSAPPGEIAAMAQDLQDYPKVQVVVHGAVAAYMLVGRSTRIKYGYHKAGDVIWVHVNDQEADPETLVPYKEASTSASIPTTPDAVRAPEPPAFKSLSTVEVPETPVEKFQAVEPGPTTEEFSVAPAQPEPDSSAESADAGQPAEDATPEVASDDTSDPQPS